MFLEVCVCSFSRRGSKQLVQFSYDVSTKPLKASIDRWYLITLKPVQTTVNWFNAVEGIILLLILKKRFLGLFSIGYFYFLEFVMKYYWKEGQMLKGKVELPKLCILFMVAGRVWYISRVAVLRIERLGTGYLFC